MSFLAELKRRNVHKVGAAYLVAAWLLIQVAATMAPQLQLPEWAPRLITLILLIGFPIALILAWFLERTPEGLKAEPAAQGNKRVVGAAIVLAALAVGWYLRGQPVAEQGPSPGGDARWTVAGAGKAEMGPESISGSVTSTATGPSPPKIDSGPISAPRRSVAVLPFVNMSGDAEQEYFADGLSEEILNSLTRIDGMQVAGRTSSFQFKGKNEDLRSIGQKLGVASVLEGSVRRGKGAMRITAQLIRVSDGIHVWSQTYDRAPDDTLAVQLDIAEHVASALDVVLDDVQRERMRASGVQNVEAFIAF
ncbi:MAG TPA: adenylyl cyclase, partial [Pseudomonadota bacterium]|nr:adenylyl cyclase [Pseudomonadota bacterium]